MSQSIKILAVLIGIVISSNIAYSAIQGGIDYQIPIDYSKLDRETIETKANIYYDKALKTSVLNDDMTTALNLCRILTNIAPDNVEYALRLGKLYDTIDKSKYAKGEFYRARSLAPNRPEPYFYLGEHFYGQEQYRKALKFYKQAYDNGYSNNYPTLYKIGDLYEKLGDTRNAIFYLEKASEIEPGIDLDLKLQQIKNVDSLNKDYYRR